MARRITALKIYFLYGKVFIYSKQYSIRGFELKTTKIIADAFAVCKDDNTIDEMNKVNIRAGLVMTPLIALFEIVMIIITGQNIASGGSPIRVSYMQCYITLLVATLVGFTLLMLWKKDPAKHRRGLMWLAHIYSALIMLWAVALTTLDVSRDGQLTVYLTVLVVLACAFYLHPWAVCLIFGGTTALLMVLLSFVTTHMLDIVINLLVFAVFMIIVSVVRYKGKKEGMFKETVIIEQNKELNGLNEQLRILSQTDMLTELYNRRYYEQTIPEIVKKCAQNAQELTAILFDIDEFKKINDTYGHKVGDACIHSVARILKDQAQRSGGTAYRFGGEEFLVIVPDCGTERGVLLAENIRKEVEATQIECVEYPVTVSAGCYSAKIESPAQAESFVNRADHAMYRAKAQGRNSVVADSE